MPIKAYNPTTPGRRGMTSQDMSEVTTRKPLKSLIKSKKQNAGRNNTGRITVRHRGGGVRRHYRLLNHRLAAGLGNGAGRSLRRPVTYLCSTLAIRV